MKYFENTTAKVTVITATENNYNCITINVQLIAAVTNKLRKARKWKTKTVS